MSRGYTKIQGLKEEILTMCEEGKTPSEIAEHFGVKDKYIVIVKKYLKENVARSMHKRKGYFHNAVAGQGLVMFQPNMKRKMR